MVSLLAVMVGVEGGGLIVHLFPNHGAFPVTQEELARSPSPGWGVGSLLVRSRQPRSTVEEVPGALSPHPGPLETPTVETPGS